MSFPRHIFPGMTVMITRRTILRTFLLRPDPDVQQIYLYCLAVFAARYGIAVHMPMLMSTHEHLMVTDVRGELPSFVRDLHRTVALCVKALRNWNGPLWDQRRTSIVHLATPEAIIQTGAYMIANPVEAGLVAKSEQWPGVTLDAQRFGSATWTIKRPDVYFDRTNPVWPESVTLELSMPNNMPMGHAEVRNAIADQVTEAELNAAIEMRTRGLRFLGSDLVSCCSPFERATSQEPSKGHNPIVSVGNGQKQARTREMKAIRAFRRAYQEAFVCWRNGQRDVAFPHGTWLMPRLHRARVEGVAEDFAEAC